MAQIELLAPNITGQFQADTIEIPSNTPTNVIPASSAWAVQCRWFLDPPGAIVGGSWRLQVIVEGLGNAPEFETAPVTILIDGRVGPANPYTQTITFPPPQPVGAQDSVLLKVSVALSYRTPANNPGPLAGFAELGVLQVFKDS